MNRITCLLILSLSAACGTGYDDVPEFDTTEDNLVGVVTCNDVFTLMEDNFLNQVSIAYVAPELVAGSFAIVTLDGAIAEATASAVSRGLGSVDAAYLRLRKTSYRFRDRTYQGTSRLTLSLTRSARPAVEFETSVESCEVTGGVATVIAQGPSNAHVVLKISQFIIPG